MISSVNNTLPIKTFRVEGKSYTSDFNDCSIFDIVRGTPLFDKFQEFIDKALAGDVVVIGQYAIMCLRVNTQAILLNIEAKKVEIENLEAML